MTDIRKDVVEGLANSATAEELAAAKRLQKENAEKVAAADAGERLGELEAQEAELVAQTKDLEVQIKSVRQEIRKCNTVLGTNTRSKGFRGAKATAVVSEAMAEIGGATRQREVIAWIVKNDRYDGKERALSSSVSQTLSAMCDAGTVVKDDVAKTYSLA